MSAQSVTKPDVNTLPSGALPQLRRRSKWENAAIAFAFLGALQMAAALLAAVILYTSYYWDEVGYAVAGIAAIVLFVMMGFISGRLRTWWWLLYVTGSLLFVAIGVSSGESPSVIPPVFIGFALASVVPILLGARIARRRGSQQIEPAGSSTGEQLLHW